MNVTINDIARATGLSTATISKYINHKKIREENGKGIWICGGANLIQQLIREDIIDYYYITVIPIILGAGIRLFEKTDHEIELKLLKTQSYNGMTDLVYTKR